MDEARERRAFTLYEDLLHLRPGDRDACLDDRCADDPAVHAAVLAMFAADARSGLLPTLPPEPHAPGDDGAMPERIGPFRIVSEIGRGGMGVVYRGVRDDGLYEQKVAIKLIRRTLFSERALAQFAIERRILARLHHPHIAQMLEGGVTADGASYIVMELVEGAPITEHADAIGLALGERLDLFVQVAIAIEHAHRNLVVHADIKPSNVVVCEGFGVKLLDFGIARLLGDADDLPHGAFTPGFGSPERRQGLPLTPADDIYGLGILLRDLLGGVAGVDADLRAIVAKACAPDAARRYGAANELVDDIARWRRHRPVAARPADRRHRALLYWRRNRVGASIGAFAAIMLLVTLALTTLLWRRAEYARAAAEQRFAETRALSLYLVNDVTEAIAPLPGSSVIEGQIAERAERTLEGLSRVPGASLEVLADSASASTRVGGILAALDQRASPDPRAADRALDRAEGILRALLSAHADRDDLRLRLVRTLLARASLLAIQRNDAAHAVPTLDRAQALTIAVLAHDPGNAAARALRWKEDVRRAQILNDGNTPAAIPPLLLPTLDRLPVHLPSPMAERALDDEQGWTLLGDAQWYGGDHRAALASYRRALAALSAPNLTTDARIVLRVIYCEFGLATTLTSLGRRQEALIEMARGVEAARRLRSFDDSPKARHMSNIAELEYAVELAALGRFGEAIPEARASIAGREALARLAPADYDTQRAVPVGLRPFAKMLRSAGRNGEACRTARQTDNLWSALGRKAPLAGFDRETELAEVAKLLRWCKARNIETAG